MDSTFDWYLRMQQKWRFRRVTAWEWESNYTLVVTRGGGLYCFEGEEFLMVFDVTRYIKQNDRVVPDGLTHMGTLRGAQAASLLQEIQRELADAESVRE